MIGFMISVCDYLIVFILNIGLEGSRKRISVEVLGVQSRLIISYQGSLRSWKQCDLNYFLRIYAPFFSYSSHLYFYSSLSFLSTFCCFMNLSLSALANSVSIILSSLVQVSILNRPEQRSFSIGYCDLLWMSRWATEADISSGWSYCGYWMRIEGSLLVWLVSLRWKSLPYLLYFSFFFRSFRGLLKYYLSVTYEKFGYVYILALLYFIAVSKESSKLGDLLEKASSSRLPT